MSDRPNDSPERIAHEIDALRAHRVYKDRDGGLGDTLSRLARGYKRDAGGLGEISQKWQELAPKDIQPLASLKSFARGVLTISASDATARYMIERSLTGGLRRGLIRSSGTTLRDVRVVVGPGQSP